MIDWTAVAVGLFSGIGGSLLTLLVAERRRWHADRREVYARFLRACGEAYRVAIIADEIGGLGGTYETTKRYAARFDEWLGPWRQALSEIRLLGTARTIAAADALDQATFATNILVVPDKDPDDLVTTDSGEPIVAHTEYDSLRTTWIQARDEFERMARRELGIDGWLRLGRWSR
jgi:hypothetical protein